MNSQTRSTSTAKIPVSKSDDFKQSFSRVFKFPIFFLKVGGFSVPSVEEITATEGRRCISFVKIAFCVFYRIFVALLHVVNAGRVIGFWVVTSHNAKESDIARTILASFLMMYGSTLFVCEHLALRFYFSSLIKGMESYSRDFGFLAGTFKEKNCVRCSTILVIIFNLLSILFWAALDAANSDRFVTSPFDVENLSSVVVALVHLTFFTHMFLMNIPIYGCLLMYSLLLGVLLNEFRCTSKMMKDVLNRIDDSTELRFDRCRERHQSLCQSVVILSKLTRIFVAVNIFYNMVIMCVSIYGLSSHDLSGEVVIFQFLSGVVVNSCIVLIVTGRWGQLSSAAHSISDAINDWSPASTRLLHKMTLFTARCSSSKIGVNMYGLFTLDSSTPLMVTGTLVTYGVVVLQFQLDHEISYCGFNSTSLENQ